METLPNKGNIKEKILELFVDVIAVQEISDSSQIGLCQVVDLTEPFRLIRFSILYITQIIYVNHFFDIKKS
jgi:hypothetical protein